MATLMTYPSPDGRILIGVHVLQVVLEPPAGAQEAMTSPLNVIDSNTFARSLYLPFTDAPAADQLILHLDGGHLLVD